MHTHTVGGSSRTDRKHAVHSAQHVFGQCSPLNRFGKVEEEYHELVALEFDIIGPVYVLSFEYLGVYVDSHLVLRPLNDTYARHVPL